MQARGQFRCRRRICMIIEKRHLGNAGTATHLRHILRFGRTVQVHQVNVIFQFSIRIRRQIDDSGQNNERRIQFRFFRRFRKRLIIFVLGFQRDFQLRRCRNEIIVMTSGRSNVRTRRSRSASCKLRKLRIFHDKSCRNQCSDDLFFKVKPVFALELFHFLAFRQENRSHDMEIIQFLYIIVGINEIVVDPVQMFLMAPFQLAISAFFKIEHDNSVGLSRRQIGISHWSRRIYDKSSIQFLRFRFLVSIVLPFYRQEAIVQFVFRLGLCIAIIQFLDRSIIPQPILGYAAISIVLSSLGFP